MSNIDMGKISITDEGTYKINKNYEKLSVVKDGSGGVYLSRKDTNGASLHNKEYWTTILNGETPIVFDTIDDMIDYDGDTTTCIVRDKDRGGVFVYDKSKIDDNDGGTIFNGWVRQYDGTVNVKWFGAVGDGVTDDVYILQKVIKDFEDIFIPAGTFVIGFTKVDSGGDNVCLEIPSNTTITGVYNNTILYIKDGANASGLSCRNGHKVSIKNIIINGNRPNQNKPASGEDSSGIRFVGTISDIKINNVTVHNTFDYGIGFECTTVTNLICDNIHVYDVNADCIDFKNTGSVSTNISLSNLKLHDFGKDIDSDELFTGLDLRGNIKVSGIEVYNVPETGTCIRFMPNTEGTAFLGGNRCIVENFKVYNETYIDNTIGISMSGVNNILTNGYIKNMKKNILVQQENNKISNVDIDGGKYGIITTADGTSGGESLGTNPDFLLLDNVAFRGNKIWAIRLVGSRYSCLNNIIVDSCENGVSIKNGSFNNITGINFNNITGTDVEISNSVDSSVNNIKGLSLTQTISKTLALDETGVKKIEFAHSVKRAPNINEVDLNFVTTEDSDAEFVVPIVISTDNSKIVVQVNVTKESSEAANLIIYVNINLVF